MRAVIFDLDGTLADSRLDFDLMRREMGLGPGPLLETIATLPETRRNQCEAILHRHESEGAERATLLPGAREWIDWLDEQRIPRAIFTRNSRSMTHATLHRCRVQFADVVAREDAPPKPDPTGILQLCKKWDVKPSETLVVGDYLYDIQAARGAGARAALVQGSRRFDFASQADFVWLDLCEGLDYLRHKMISSIQGEPAR